MIRSLILLVICASLGFHANSQEEDLLKGIDSTDARGKVEYAFKSPRIIMTHSIQMLKKGVLDFRILHRFGPVNGGFDEFFGLDDATMRIGLDYGLTNNFTIGFGRSTFLKELRPAPNYRNRVITTFHCARGRLHYPQRKKCRLYNESKLCKENGRLWTTIIWKEIQ